jgi:hypothetical protein
MSTEQKQLLDVLMTAIGNALASLHTATVSKVTVVNAKTINCRPVVNRVVDGVSIALPEFIDVPVLTMQGGGSYTAYPVAVGDYVLLVFTERCFDRWWNGQDYRPPLELRMHDYSDGIALLGLNPLAGLIPIPETIKQVGDTVQTGDYTHTGNLTRTGDMTITGDLTLTGDIEVTGNITCTGTIAAAGFSGLSGTAMTSSVNFVTTGEVTANGKSLSTHTHPVTTSPGETGTPS